MRSGDELGERRLFLHTRRRALKRLSRGSGARGTETSQAQCNDIRQLKLESMHGRCSAPEFLVQVQWLCPVQHRSLSSQAASPERSIHRSALTSCMHMHTCRRLAVQVRVRRRSVMRRQRTLRVFRKMVWCPHSRTYQHSLLLLRHVPQATFRGSSRPQTGLERQMQAAHEPEQL